MTEQPVQPQAFFALFGIFLQLGRPSNGKMYDSDYLEKTSGGWIFMSFRNSTDWDMTLILVRYRYILVQMAEKRAKQSYYVI